MTERYYSTNNEKLIEYTGKATADSLPYWAIFASDGALYALVSPKATIAVQLDTEPETVFEEGLEVAGIMPDPVFIYSGEMLEYTPVQVVSMGGSPALKLKDGTICNLWDGDPIFARC